MSIYRSYFLKNTSIVSSNLTNSSQNPVTEISYGTEFADVSRFIFDVDLSNLGAKIAQGLLIPNASMKHVLHMTNTISYAPQYIGRKSYSTNINRASSFDLDFFNINQEWDEGSGYDLIYREELVFNQVEQASNWSARTTTSGWTVAGAYQSGVTQIIDSQHFDVGNENISIDITDYINQRLYGTGYTGTTAYTGDTYGIGIKFPLSFEEQKTAFREAVAFHAKNTNTWYEPYVETTIDNTIVDDRNYFYLDKENSLYLYLNNNLTNVVINKVEISNQDGDLLATITTGITKVSAGIYKINLSVSSTDYPDAVLFTDKWFLTINGKSSEYIGDFYLIAQNEYYGFNNANDINFDNYFFYFWGIGEREKLMAGNVRKIKLTIKELYPNQNKFVPLDIEYRVFTTVGGKYEINVIPFTPVNRTNTGYYFNLDTSWLIPQDYKLQIRLKNGDYYENKQTLSFTIVSDGIILV
jgi:hypothetical protein